LARRKRTITSEALIFPT